MGDFARLVCYFFEIKRANKTFDDLDSVLKPS